MTMTVEDRVRKATAARVEKARARRFDRYAEEIEGVPSGLSTGAQDKLAEALRRTGWIVVLDL